MPPPQLRAAADAGPSPSAAVVSPISTASSSSTSPARGAGNKVERYARSSGAYLSSEPLQHPSLQRKHTTSAVAAALNAAPASPTESSHSKVLQRKFSRRPTADKTTSLSDMDVSPAGGRTARAKPVVREYDAHVKLLMLGDSAVGKTSLLQRFCGGTFEQEHVLTIGVDFKSRLINSGSEKLKLQIWDTAGQERFRNLTPVYFRTAAGVLLVFDVTSRKSFDNITSWMRDLDETAREEAFRVLVGNKCDLSEKRQVTSAEGEKLAAMFGIKYFETSAKENLNIDAPFVDIARDIRAFQVDPSRQAPRSGLHASSITLSAEDASAARRGEHRGWAASCC